MNTQHKALIIGEHPVRECIAAQLSHLGYEVIWCREVEKTIFQEVWQHIVVLSVVENSEATTCDATFLKVVSELFEILKYKAAYRPTVHLLLNSQETLRLIRTREYADDWHAVFELNAFTMEDVWAKNVVSPVEGKRGGLTGLDYRPITFESDLVVHLVVFGTSSLTTALAENAALVAHYPNYVRNHSLRTRITVIDAEAETWSHTFISRHRALMDNSYYRQVDVQTKDCVLHRPMYEGRREDFVDVEWEFVHGTLSDVVVQDKLQGWSDDEGQVLSVAICHDDDEENLAQAQEVARLLCNHEVPIYVKQHNSALEDLISQSPRMKNVHLIGLMDSGYDVTLPLLQMAKRVKYVYDYCFTNNVESDLPSGCITAPSYIDLDEVERGWLQERKAIKRYSNLSNAMTLATKMRSLGHEAKELHTFYAIAQDEIEQTARVEHNRWNVEELLLGYRPCTDAEQAEIEADISKKTVYKDMLVHYDLRAYDDLRPDATGKNVNTYDLCLSASIPLIVFEAL